MEWRSGGWEDDACEDKKWKMGMEGEFPVVIIFNYTPLFLIFTFFYEGYVTLLDVLWLPSRLSLTISEAENFQTHYVWNLLLPRLLNIRCFSPFPI